MPSLLVLAAGLGSRYGGLKQIDPVGPSGEALLDYAVYDALQAGFGRAVFVIRRDFEPAFRERVRRYAGRIPVELAFQALDALPAGFAPPPGREKPWGTAHAVWCAREVLREDFAVINADDFYGRDAYARLARFLSQPASSPPRFALVAYRLGQTLSEHGTVSRGVCATDGGRLVSIREEVGISAAEVGPGRKFSGEEPVSMNCWGFTPQVFPLLEERLREFLDRSGREAKAELYLPAAVSDLMRAGRAEVAALASASGWFGVTYRDDRPRVAAAVAELVRRGEYPTPLFP